MYDNNKKVHLTIELDDFVYESFSNAIKSTGKGIDDVVRDFMIRYAQTKNEQTEHNKMKTDNADYYAKAYERIPIWANKPHQLNSMIVWSFFKAEEIDGFATINLMKGLCIDRGMSEHQFKINYASMKSDSSNNHGKVFEDDGENVWIWEEIRPRLMQYKNAFYKGE